MSDEWTYSSRDPADELARLHVFSMKKPTPGGTVEFRITVREFAENRSDQSMRFFAEADKQTNQGTSPYTPSGWGNTLSKALGDCVRAVHRFPYEGNDED